MNNIKNRLKDFFRRVYVNSYGFDDLGKALIITYFVLFFINLLFRSRIFYFLAEIDLLYFVIRFFSKKKFKRSEENRKYRRLVKYAKLIKDNYKTHHILVCKNCGQFIRIPKGKGNIEVTCPHCASKFDFKS